MAGPTSNGDRAWETPEEANASALKILEKEEDGNVRELGTES